MQICGLGVAEFRLLPKGPLIAFLVVQNVGYLVAFTAGGQTLGKMAAGIEIVHVGSDDVARPGPRPQRTRRLARAGVPGRPRLAAGALQPRSPRPPRSFRRHARCPRLNRQSIDRHRVFALAVATALGVGYAPFAPGTFGSAAGLLLWWLLRRRRSAQAARSSCSSSLGSWSGSVAERHFGRTDPGQVVIDEVMGMLDHAVPQSRSAGSARSPAFSCFASSTSSSRIRRTGSSGCTAASASWPTTRWRRSTRTWCCAAWSLVIWSAGVPVRSNDQMTR